ncbi:MAG: mechanosensitive ion channel domain-containing protein [Solirubrobacterales bacterium]
MTPPIPMIPLADLNDFVDENTDLINATATLLAALVIAKLVDRFVSRSGMSAARKVAKDDLSRATVTRLRLIRRLVFAVIVLVGLGLALSQISALKPLANALLASSAVLGIAVGLGARGMLANGVAGIMIASVQPFRIGDVIQWEGHHGLVEDITLTYTFVRLPSGHRLVVPNEAIASSPLENYTITGSAVDTDASVWVVPPRATASLALLRDRMGDFEINIGECEQHRIELKIGFSTSAEQEARRRIAAREQAVRLLSDAGMLEAPPG